MFLNLKSSLTVFSVSTNSQYQNRSLEISNIKLQDFHKAKKKYFCSRFVLRWLEHNEGRRSQELNIATFLWLFAGNSFANLSILEMSYVVPSRKYEKPLFILSKTSIIFSKTLKCAEMYRIREMVLVSLMGSNLQRSEVGKGLNLVRP